MAGTMLSPSPTTFDRTTIETTSDSASFSECMPITTVIDQFEVEYARYVNYPPLSGLISTHQSLIPQTAYYRNRFRSGAWLKAIDSSVFVKIVPARSKGYADAVLMVYHRYKVLVRG